MDSHEQSIYPIYPCVNEHCKDHAKIRQNDQSQRSSGQLPIAQFFKLCF
jgi:hypothetical protein